MIFEPLMESARRGELILVEGGLCHWHLRRDGQLTIREIIVLPERQKQGIGISMLDRLKSVPGAKSIFAKCPAGLASNGWYERVGFSFEGKETTRGGRKLKLWRLKL
jgi:hypothetical protein